MAGERGFENLVPIFGEAEAEVEPPPPPPPHHHHQHRPFLFYVHALDSARIEILASDFHSLTFSQVLTVHQLDDLRDDIGIGGSWSEFVDYLIVSLTSGKVKVTMGGVSTGTVDSGEVHAKLVAHKAKGLPRISILLNKLFNSSAQDATAKFSHALFRVYKEKHNDYTTEHERLLQVEGLLSSEKERSENVQRQLDGLSFNNKRKMHKSKAPDKPSLVLESTTDNNTTSVLETQLASSVSKTQPLPSVFETQTQSALLNAEKSATGNGTQPLKAGHRVGPMSRRPKRRGVSLQDNGDSDD